MAETRFRVDGNPSFRRLEDQEGHAYRQIHPRAAHVYLITPYIATYLQLIAGNAVHCATLVHKRTAVFEAAQSSFHRLRHHR